MMKVLMLGFCPCAAVQAQLLIEITVGRSWCSPKHYSPSQASGVCSITLYPQSLERLRDKPMALIGGLGTVGLMW
jgi:hypothetical protein